jgi:leucyl/phenylalanyl-tRNA--protein transferase
MSSVEPRAESSAIRWGVTPQPVGEPRWRFPPVPAWPDDDLIAAGGDLEPATLIGAYRRGIFPMELSAAPDTICWWSPDPRGIIPLDGLRVTRSMRQSAKRFDVRVDTCFADIMRACADPSRKDGWITIEFIEAYSKLHALGWAHSIEVFDRHGTLAGGLYGVRINGLFAGESMFHRQRDASKVALMFLVDLMRESGMAILDTQWCTEHLASLGAIDVPRDRYLAMLTSAVGSP